eukprot:2060898-Lingulodinium_polyedra.AAC.1
MGMDAGAVRMAAGSLIHGKAEMRVSPQQNDRLAAGIKHLRRALNDVNEEMDRLEINARQRPQ